MEEKTAARVIARQNTADGRAILSFMSWPSMLLHHDLTVVDRNTRASAELLGQVGIGIDDNGRLRLWSTEATRSFKKLAVQTCQEHMPEDLDASTSPDIKTNATADANPEPDAATAPPSQEDDETSQENYEFNGSATSLFAIDCTQDLYQEGVRADPIGYLRITCLRHLFLPSTPPPSDPPLFIMRVCHSSCCPKLTVAELIALSDLTEKQAGYALARLQDGESNESYAKKIGRRPATVEDGLRKARENLGFGTTLELQEWLWQLRFAKF